MPTSKNCRLTNTDSSRKQLRKKSHMVMMALEQRFMFDGAAAAAAVDAGADALIPDVPVPVEIRAAEPAKDNGKKEVVFIDTSVANYKALEAGVKDGVAIVEIDGSKDGLAQIAKWAETHAGFDAIHIFSHGSEATLHLGSNTVTETTLSTVVAQAELAEIGKALTADGDILLYGCDIAKSTDGQQFIADLAAATGADVAASIDATGSAILGGNWTLEKTTGAVDVAAVNDVDYDGLLSYSTATATYTVETLGTNRDVDAAVGLPSDKSAILLRDATGARYLKVYDSAGSLLSSTKVTDLMTSKVLNSEQYSLFGLANGNILVEYNSSDSSGNTNYNAYFIIVDQTGAIVVNQTQINGTGYSMTSQSRNIDIAQLSNGNIAFSWQRGDNSSFGTRVFTTSGAAVSGEVLVASANGSVSHIAASSNGTYMVEYSYSASGTNYDAYSIYNNSGVLQSSGSFYSGGTGHSYDLFALSSGSYLYTYTDYSNSYGKIVSASGAAGAAFSIPNMGSGYVAAVYTSGSEGFVVASITYSPALPGTVVDWTGTVTLSLKSYDNNGTFVSTTSAVDSGPGNWKATSSYGYMYYGVTYSPSFYLYSGYTRGIGVIKTDYPNIVTSSGSDTSHTIGSKLFDQSSGPTTTVSTAALSADTGASSTDFITKTAAQTISGTLSANLAAGERVEVSYDGGSSWSNATSYSVGSNSWSTTTTLSGSNTFEVRVANASGGGTAYSHTYTLDTANPAVPSTPDLATASDSGSSSTDNITSVTTPVFAGTAEANATVTLYDTDGTTVLGTTTANGAGNWSITSSALSAGAHTLTAKATDAAGNTGAASSSLSVTIDATAPAAPSAPDLATGSDSGTSSTDNLTKVTTPVFTGTAEANATVKLYDTDGTTVLGTTTADGSGNWSITSSALSAGAHTLTAKATDVAGNTGSASGGLAITIDTANPAAPSTPDLATASDSGISSTDNITSVTTPVFTGTAEANATVTLFDTDGTTVLGTTTANGAGNWSITSSALSAGAHTLTAKATDVAGNTGAASAGLVITIDTANPAAPSTPDLAAASDSGTSSTDNITNVTTPVFTGTAEANATVTLFDTDGTTILGTTTANGAGNWSITSSVLSAGAHTLTAKATDAAGNTGVASSSLSVTIDTSAPTASVTAATVAIGSNVTTNQSTETGVVYLVKSTVTPTDYASLEAAVAGNNAAKATVSAANSNTLINTAGLAVGTYYTYAVDAAGNVSAASGNAITLAQGPSITVSTAAFSADTGTSSSDFVTKTAAQTLSGTLSGNTVAGETVEVSLDNGSTWTTASNTVGQNTWSLAGQTLTGSNTLQVRVTNAVGSSAALSQAYILDTVAPTITMATKAFSADTGVSASDFITKTAAQTISGTLSSNLAAGETVEVSLDNGSTWTTATTTVGQNTWSLAGQTLTGNNTLQVRVSDDAGNHGTASTQLYVLDQTAPTVSDARIGISGASGTGGAFKIGDTVTATWNNAASGDNNSDIAAVTVDFSAFGGGAAVAATNSGGTWSATYTIVAGAIDGINKNVSVTATDNAGNVTTQSDSSNATLDNIAPTVTDGNIDVISSGSGPGGKYVIGDTLTVRWRDTGGDANVDTIAGVTVDFSAFGGGTAVVATNVGGVWTASYTVTSASIDGSNLNAAVTVTDNAGNSKTTADSSNLTLDLPPTVTDARIGISGASGSGGAFKLNDIVTATWNNTATGDNNSDVASVTVDFSAFGGGTAVAATNSNGTWTAAYTIVTGVTDGSNKNVSVRVTDNAGNVTICADTTNATVRTSEVPPVVNVEPPPPPPPPTVSPPIPEPAPPVLSPSSFLPPASTLGNPTLDAILAPPSIAPPPALTRSFAPDPATGRTGESGGFQVTTIVSQRPGQDSLVVFKGIRDQVISGSGQASEFVLPADAFASTNASAVVHLQARQADGRPLPGWVSFDPQTGTFRVQAPPGISQDIVIKVVARDAQGHEAVTTFKIRVGEKGQRPSGRAGLSEQIRLAARPHATLDRLAPPLRRSA